MHTTEQASLLADLSECDYYMIKNWRDIKSAGPYGLSVCWNNIVTLKNQQRAIVLRLLDTGMAIEEINMFIPMDEDLAA